MVIEGRGYQLPEETIPSLGLSFHLDDISAFKELLLTRGIQTQNTRIDRYIAYLQHASNHGPNDASKIFKQSIDDRFQLPIDWLLYVLREVHELAWIHRGLSASLPLGADDKLRTIVSGRDFAALDADSHSRDTQFELRIASYFCQTGYEVDLSQETDVIALKGDHGFYVECKRIAQRTQLKKRLSAARAQLKRSIPKNNDAIKIFGCVAADVTKVAFPNNGLILGVTNEHSRTIIQEKLIEIGNAAQSEPIFDGCKKLLSYWFQIHIPSLIQHPPVPLTRFSSYHVARTELGRRERSALKKLHAMFEAASDAIDARATAPRRLKLRNHIQLPAGTQFSFDDELVAEILAGVAQAGVHEDTRIGSLSIDRVDHDFSATDLQQLPAALFEEWTTTRLTDPQRANLTVLLEMYLRRYPYEDTP